MAENGISLGLNVSGGNATYFFSVCYDTAFVHLFISPSWHWATRFIFTCLALIYCTLGLAVFLGRCSAAAESFLRSVAPAEEEKSRLDVVKGVVFRVCRISLLSALIFSSPELFLPAIELSMGHRSLGAPTVVGSAAFNIMVIVGAATLVAAPTKQIKELRFYVVSMIFALFAYAWLIIITVIHSPNRIDLWEAVLTLVFYGIFFVLAILLDSAGALLEYRRKISNLVHDPDTMQPYKSIENGFAGREQIVEFVQEVNRIHPKLSHQDIVMLTTHRLIRYASHTTEWTHASAGLELSGAGSLVPPLTKRLRALDRDYENIWDTLADGGELEETEDEYESKCHSIVEFTCTQLVVTEAVGSARVGISRTGALNKPTQIKVETVDGSAKAGYDYVPVSTVIKFDAGEASKSIDIAILKDNEKEPDEVFFMRIVPEPKFNSKIGNKSLLTVTIVDDEKYPEIAFPKASFLTRENAGTAHIPVERKFAFNNAVSIKYRSSDLSAKSDPKATGGADYEAVNGTLIFEAGECVKQISVNIIDNKDVEKMENFKLELYEASPGVKIGAVSATVVCILDDEEYLEQLQDMSLQLEANRNAATGLRDSWIQQFRSAMSVNGGDSSTATDLSYFLHLITFNWKVTAAILPPPSLLAGLPALITSLLFVFLVTFCVYDLTTLLSCLTSTERSVFAFSLLAVAFNILELISSIQAACREKYADAAILTLPTAVAATVFLGLGLPWSIYFAFNDEPIYVDSDPLRFSLAVLCIAAMVIFTITVVKRFTAGGELGGRRCSKWFIGCFFIVLWFLFVIVCDLFALRLISFSENQ